MEMKLEIQIFKWAIQFIQIQMVSLSLVLVIAYFNLLLPNLEEISQENSLQKV